MRYKPSTKSKILKKLNAFDNIQIVSKCRKEKIARWATHNCYKINSIDDVG